MLWELNYGVSVNVLNHIDMESILGSWDGSRFNYPYWVNDAAVELDWDIIKYFGLDGIGRLSDQSYSHAQKYCMSTSAIPLQDRIKILEFVEKIADASAIFTLLDNILHLEMCVISTMGIDKVLPLCGNGESVEFGNPSWLMQCKAEMEAMGAGADADGMS